MAKREYFVETHRNYKVANQLLAITSIDFKTKTIIGFTELQIVSQVDNLSVIRLNCQQCRIQSIYINDYMCEFTYSDPTQEILSSTEKKGPRKLDTFSNAHYDVIKTTDSDFGNGELIIQIPDLSDLKTAVLEHKILHLYIAYMVENPTGGVYFAVNDKSNEETEKPAVVPVVDEKAVVFPKENSQQEECFVPHMFTYGRTNSSRLWFPCVDSFSESCTWTVMVTVDDIFTAIASGDLEDVEHNVEKKKKRYIYSLQVPTSAPNIGLVVGPFVPVVHPTMHEVIHFCFPSLKSLLLDTCAFTHSIFMHYEEMLNTRYPYTNYKQVFVDNMLSKYEAYATLSIFSINLLHSKHVIEQTYISRRVLAQAIAEQYFGCFISMQTTADAWLTRGISGYLAYDYYKKAFGNNEYRYHVKGTMDKVIKYEQQFRPIVLDPSKRSYSEKDYFHIKNFHTFSPIYDKMHRKKSFLTMRMLESYLGKTLLLQVFNKMLSLAQIAAPQKFVSASWFNLHASTASFIWAISTVTGKNIDTFLKQWVFQGGHVKLTGSFIFNRKRNTVELEIKQVHINETGVRRYLGPLMIWLQELDGTFKHTLQIEDNLSKHDLTCHSKSRRNKKKKIPLCTGEEIDMDLSGMDQESPVLWLRIDPEMTLLRQVVLEQPDYQWQYQLRYERDVIAQIESLAVLDRFFSNIGTRNSLIDIINNEHVFYRVRCEATFCLRRVANYMGSNWAGPPAMLNLFRKMFGSPSCPHIVRMNKFDKFHLYFIQKAMIVAMAGLRTVHGICPHEVLRFLLDLFKYNDNTKNNFTDAYFRASLVDALVETVTPVAIAPIFNSSSLMDMLSQDTKNILEEITRCFNLDKLLPSYKQVVTISCLRAIRHLQKMGHLPSNPQIFRCHTSNNCFIEVRRVAIEILVDIVKAEVRKDELDFLLNLVTNDETQPIVKFYTFKYLISNPPFSFTNDELNPLDTEDLVERLWSLMNNSFSSNSKLRCAVVDLYYVLYGRGRPKCLPKPEFSFVLNLKEKKSALSNSNMATNIQIPENMETDEPSEPVKDNLSANAPSEIEGNKHDETPMEIKTNVEENEKENNEETLKFKINADNISMNETTDQIETDKEKMTEMVTEKDAEPINEPKKVIDREKEDADFFPDLDHEDGQIEVTPSPSTPFIPNDEGSQSIPTFTIKKSAEVMGPEYSNTSKAVMRIGISPVKKKKEDKERKNEDGSIKEKHKEKHHKEKKKKKKKHKNKHKHKHKHHSADQS